MAETVNTMVTVEIATRLTATNVYVGTDSSHSEKLRLQKLFQGEPRPRVHGRRRIELIRNVIPHRVPSNEVPDTYGCSHSTSFSSSRSHSMAPHVQARRVLPWEASRPLPIQTVHGIVSTNRPKPPVAGFCFESCRRHREPRMPL